MKFGEKEISDSLGSTQARNLFNVDEILDKAINGGEVNIMEGIKLFHTQGLEKEKLFSAADRLRQRVNGEKVTFVINRNINFTI